jgi:hypothetical protein
MTGPRRDRSEGASRVLLAGAAASGQVAAPLAHRIKKPDSSLDLCMRLLG